MAAILALCSLFLPTVIAGTRSEVRECAFFDHHQQRRPNQLPQDNNGTVRCGPGLACFGLWEQKPGGDVLLLKQGCWTSKEGCLSDLCLVTAPPAHIHQGSYRFCCCSRNLCNSGFREAPPTTHPPMHRLPDDGSVVLPGNSPALVAVGTVAVTVAVVSLLFCGYSLLKGKKKLSSSSVTVTQTSSTTTTTPSDDLDQLRLWEVVGRGRFACVYRGTVSDRAVAVKAFLAAQRQKYQNQSALYRRLPVLQHQRHLAHFLSAHERSDPAGGVQHLILMEYYPHGSLSDFLSRSSVDWPCCCRMVLGATRGLSFLHSEIQTGDQCKPAVAHRDVSSTNVLVRADLSCVLSGFSLAMTLSRESGAAHGDPGSVNISEAGSLRYRAPELLSGALDLREYGAALKQVDVYALGLVLWESFRRCHHLFPVRETPHFELAFESELGQEPGLEEMHDLVARDKYRPLFPRHWRHNSPVLRLLKETMEDCWDQDAEARLSVHCAEERLSQLSQLPVPTAPTLSVDFTGCQLPNGCTSPEPLRGAQCFQDTAESNTRRSHAAQRPQQQVPPQRPCSLQLLSTSKQRAPESRERPGAKQSRENPGGPQCRDRQVETGVAKLNALPVQARAPITVTMANNRGAVLMADGSSAGAPILVTNSLMMRGVTNQAGPQTEDDCRRSDDVASLEQEAGLNFFWSPDEDQPLLKNEVFPAGARMVVQSNVNNNNNYCNLIDPWTYQRRGRSDGTWSPRPSLTESNGENLSEDMSHCKHNPDIEILNYAISIEAGELNLSCRDGVQMSISERQETAVILVDSPKDSADKRNMDVVIPEPSEEPHRFSTSYSSVPDPGSLLSTEDTAGVCVSLVSSAQVSTQAQSSAAVSLTSTDSSERTPDSQRERGPERPCSLDLSSPVTDGAPLTDSGLSASGEKIRRRVKTPYTVKKWRPASWAPPADHQPILLLQATPDCPRISQSKSSMAVVHLGAPAPSGPDGLTSF